MSPLLLLPRKQTALPTPTYYRQPVSPRFLVQNGDDCDAAFTTQTWAQSKMVFTAPEALNGFQVDSVGFNIQNNTGSEQGQTARTVRGKLEYPGGVFYDFTWAAAATKLISNSSVSNLSDVLTLPGDIPAAASYTIHWEEVGSAYTMTASARSLSGEAYGSDTSSMPTLGASYAGSSVATKMVGPNMVTALHTQFKPFLGFLGDSNMVDQMQTRDALGVAGFPRAIDASANCTKFAMSGNRLSVHKSSFIKRKTFLQTHGAQHLFILLGTNDLPASGDSSATLIADLDTLAAAVAGSLIPHFFTLPPRSGGAEATRLPVNAYIRSVSGTGNYGAYFELADVVETARDSGTWKGGYSSDSIHIAWSNAGVRTAVLNAFSAYYTGLGI